MKFNSSLAAIGALTIWCTQITGAQAQSQQLDQITVVTDEQTDQNPGTTPPPAAEPQQETLPGVPGVVLTRQEIELINPADLQDIFADETSVSVGGSTPVSQKIYVHGIEDNNLAVTVDGALQSNSVFHHAGTMLIDPSLLKAARVNAGVAPADVGPGALAGSIEFETVDPKDLLAPGKQYGGFVKSTFDTNSEAFSTGVAAYTRNNGFEALGYYKFIDGDNYEAGNGVEQDATAASLKSGLAKLAYEAMSGDRVEFSYEAVNDDALRPYRANFAYVVRGTTIYPNQPYDLMRQTMAFTYTDETPTGWWDPKLVIGYNHTELETFPDYGSFADIRTVNAKFENNFKVALGSVVAGVDFFDTKSEGGEGDGPLSSNFTAREKDRNFGLYTQARLTPTENSRLSFGGRVDHQQFEGVDGTKLDDTGLSGNISGEYDLNEIFTIKAGYGHVFGRIPLAEALIIQPTWTYDGVETFSSDNFTAGLAANYKGFSFDIAYFNTRLDDAIAYYPARGSSNRDYTADVESEGFDVAVGYRWDSGFFKAKYSNTEVTLDGQPIGSTAFYYGTNMGEIITLQLVHEFQGTGVTVGADAQIALKLDDVIDDGAADQAIPAYEVFNAFVQYIPPTMKNLKLRVDAYNIFDELYSDRATSAQEYSYITPLREPGRSFMFSARAEF